MQSVWQASLPPSVETTSLPRGADVVIVGAGLTGLWTAYYLHQLAPERKVLIVEAEHVGFGASGRNGGWCTAEMPTLLGNLVRRYGPMAAMRFFRAARKSLDEIEKVLAEEGIDADWQRDGSLYVARTPPQRDRLLGWQHMQTLLGITDTEYRTSPTALKVDGVLLSAFTPHCAVVNPAKLADGLAQALRRRGVTICEYTRVLHIGRDRVTTDQGDIQAKVVLCATEGYTGSLTGHARRVLPVVSRAIATAPLPESAWGELGWHDRVTVADSRYQFCYFQRTADNRLLAGGRGVAYRARSGTEVSAKANERAFTRLRLAIAELFPPLSAVEIAYGWSGAYGLHRDSEPAVVFDPATSRGHAGGYSGEGLALSNLAGRTLAALVSGQPKPETKLCWAGHRSRRWEPEPLRMLGVRVISGLATIADNYEDRRHRKAPLAALIMRAVL